MIGPISRDEALKKAEEEGLDLVEISPDTFPPVTKIMDWGKHKYDLSKKNSTSKKQRSQEIKTLRLSSKIGEHDLQVKVKRAIKFLEKGYKIKAQLFFKGREITHKDVGIGVLNKFKVAVEDYADVEQDIKAMGREMNVTFTPKKK